jgi:hypothetical protein
VTVYALQTPAGLDVGYAEAHSPEEAAAEAEARGYHVQRVLDLVIVVDEPHRMEAK